MVKLKLLITYYLLIKYIHTRSVFHQITNEDNFEYEYRKTAANCVLNAARLYFEKNTALTFSLPTSLSTGKSMISTDILLLSGLSNELDWSVFVNKANEIGVVFPYNVNLANNYILQVRSIEEFERNLKQLVKYQSWNPHANFLVMLNKIVEDVITFVSYFLEKLWRHQVINAVIMVHNSSNPKHLNCYTWSPYTEGHCGNQFKNPTIVGECLNERIYSNQGLYMSKIPPQLSGCPVRVQTCIIEPYVIKQEEIIDDENNASLVGMEVLLLNIIAQKLNFTTIYRVSEKHNTLAHTLKEMAFSRADISIGAIPSDNDKHQMFDFTVTYLDESVTWCVPTSEETPRWKNFIFSFSYQSWSLIIFSYVSCSILTWLLSRNDLLETINYRNLGKIFLWNYSILLNIPIPKQPMRVTARYIIYTYILFCFIANVTFQTFLMSVLTGPIFEKQISNFDELIETDLDFGIMESHRRFYEADPKYKDILQKAIICDDIRSCLHNVSFYKNIAVAVPRLYMNYIGNRYINSKGRHLIYAFKSDIVSYPIEMLMTKGFSLLEKFNGIILHLKETGLLSKWQNDYLTETYSIEETIEPENETVKKGLSLEEIQIAFLALYIGTTIATLVFILEYCWKRSCLITLM